MRIALAAIAALSLAACSKPASQSADTSNPAPADAAAPAPAPVDAANTGNAAVKDAHQETPTASAGANSFTEAQAKEHLRNAGYADVTAMNQDSNGVWHGTATKAGKSLPVTVDFKGNITPQ